MIRVIYGWFFLVGVVRLVGRERPEGLDTAAHSASQLRKSYHN